MTPDDVLGLFLLFEGLAVLWGVVFSVAAVRTAVWCCRQGDVESSGTERDVLKARECAGECARQRRRRS